MEGGPQFYHWVLGILISIIIGIVLGKIGAMIFWTIFNG